MQKLNRLYCWISNMLWTNNIFRYKIEIIGDNPNPHDLKEDIVYVVVNEKYAKWAYLKCPCGCNDTLMLSLNAKRFPSWEVKQDKIGRATISPSVRKIDGCRSHFLIKKGKLIWAYPF